MIDSLCEALRDRRQAPGNNTYSVDSMLACPMAWHSCILLNVIRNCSLLFLIIAETKEKNSMLRYHNVCGMQLWVFTLTGK